MPGGRTPVPASARTDADASPVDCGLAAAHILRTRIE